MFTFSNSSKSGLVTTVAGMALLGLTLSGRAMAQDHPVSGSSMQSSSTMTAMDRDDMISDADIPDPAPVQYPMAAPGALDLYHYVTYRGNILEPGSVTDARMEKERRMDARFHRMTITEDPSMIDPAPWGYPMAAPGALDLYHFESYRSNTLVDGSITDARMEKARARDGRLRMETRFTEDEEMVEPAPLEYPMASPGGLDLYHFHSYGRNTLMSGSVTEMREHNAKKRDEKRKLESPGLGSPDKSNK